MVARIEKDTNGSGKADVIETYDVQSGKSVLAKREEDRNGDGTVDITSIYENGKLVRREISDPALAAQPCGPALQPAPRLRRRASLRASRPAVALRRRLQLELLALALAEALDALALDEQHQLLVALAHALELERELALGEPRGLELELERRRCRCVPSDESAVTRTWFVPSRTGTKPVKVPSGAGFTS